LAALIGIPARTVDQASDLTPMQQREQTQLVVLQCLRQYATRQPVLFIVEDLQWADPATLHLLSCFVEEGLHDRILTVLTFRPEFETPWRSRAHQTQVAVNRLTRRQVAAIIEQRTGRSESAESVARVIDRTRGVPIFVDELCKIQNALRKIGAETQPDVGSVTLQDLLEARSRHSDGV
jgi:predicted ATPase